MRRAIYVVRHAGATGQAADAPLSAAGERQAVRLAERLAGEPIERIVSSPFARAVRSIAPLAERLRLPVVIDDRLRERVLGAADLADWVSALRASFDDPELCLQDGESGRAAMRRAVAALSDVLAHGVRTSVIVTHGNLMTLLLQHFDPTIGFVDWQRLTTPDVYRVEVVGRSSTIWRVRV